MSEKFGIAEKPQNELPVLVDVDLKVRMGEGEEKMRPLYNLDQVEKLIQIYHAVFREILPSNSYSEETLMCVLLEKPAYIVEGNHDAKYLKNGFHLHFPNLFISKINQEVHLIPRVLLAQAKQKLFTDEAFMGDVIDKSCCSVPWLLYGSRKKYSMDTYKVTKIYDTDLNELTLEEAFENYKIYDDREKQIPLEGKIEYYLPRILSIIPYNRDTYELKTGLSSPVKKQIEMKHRTVKTNKYKDMEVDKQIALASKLLPLLSDKRSENHNDWMSVGWVLYNISNGSVEGLELWLEFSKKSKEKFNEYECIHKWEKMIKKNLTLGTLRYYASIDNPTEYSKLRKEESNSFLEESLNGSHTDIANILFTEYGDKFKCASIRNKTWYEFKDHIWRPNECGYKLRKKISCEIAERYKEYSMNLFQRVNNMADQAEESRYETRIKQIRKMCANLRSAPFKNNVMNECVDIFYDPEFNKRLDMNPYLIAFKNGVYDLKLNILRDGKPEDYLSKCLPINYDRSLHEMHPKVQAVEHFLEQILPDKPLRRYFKDISSDIFQGGNSQKIVPIWQGHGDNGKSVMQKIFEKMFGPYAVKLNTTVVTGKKVQGGCANADLARTGGGVRWVVMEEPEPTEMINDGILNNLSGNDSFFARDLFEKGKDISEITPLFKIILICNNFPKLRNNLPATWNRIRVIPFEATFVRPEKQDTLPATYEEQLQQKRFPTSRRKSPTCWSPSPGCCWSTVRT
jgi:P4 family phage/plasmid primase-like protien